MRHHGDALSLLEEVKRSGDGAKLVSLLGHISGDCVEAGDVLRSVYDVELRGRGHTDTTPSSTAQSNAELVDLLSVCEGALQMRILGRGIAVAFFLSASCVTTFVHNMSVCEASFVDVYNEHVDETPGNYGVPPALYSVPQCAVCGEDGAGVECPHCFAERCGGDGLFVCSQACMNRVWTQHAASHYLQRCNTAQRLRRKRRRRSPLATTARLIVRNLHTLLFLLTALPICVYLYTISSKKLFGFYANMLMGVL